MNIRGMEKEEIIDYIDELNEEIKRLRSKQQENEELTNHIDKLNDEIKRLRSEVNNDHFIEKVKDLLSNSNLNTRTKLINFIDKLEREEGDRRVYQSQLEKNNQLIREGRHPFIKLRK